MINLNTTIIKCYIFVSTSIIFFIGCRNHNHDLQDFETNIDTTFFMDGSVESINRSSIHNLDYQLYEQYYENGKLRYKGAMFKDHAVGPIEFYDTNGVLELYNERDLNNHVYYVKKIFEGELIKEEGVALSPSIFVSFSGKFKIFSFCYAKPVGYDNNITVQVDSVNADYTDIPTHHIGYLALDTSVYLQGLHHLRINSTLMKNGIIIDESSAKLRN